MAVYPITKRFFNQFHPESHPFGIRAPEEHAWFSSGDVSLIGVVVLDLVDEDWSFAIWQSDAAAIYRFNEGEPLQKSRCSQNGTGRGTPGD